MIVILVIVLETKRHLDLDEGRRSRASNVGGRRRLNRRRGCSCKDGFSFLKRSGKRKVVAESGCGKWLRKVVAVVVAQSCCGCCCGRWLRLRLRKVVGGGCKDGFLFLMRRGKLKVVAVVVADNVWRKWLRKVVAVAVVEGGCGRWL